MTLQFEDAVKSKAKLRLALVGPAGSGKTYTALAIATHLNAGPVAVVDTERGSARLYADKFKFKVLELDTGDPQRCIDALHLAAKSGIGVCIIDSGSAFWSGRGGVLDMVDGVAKRSQSKNSFNAWRDVTPIHNALVDAILSSPMHIIMTMRAKTEYVLEKDERTGKTVPRKIGLQPVQRENIEYEFTVVADMTQDDNDMIIGKTRCSDLSGKVYRRAGKDVADVLNAWLTDGAEPAPVPPPAPKSEPKPKPQTLAAPLAVSVAQAWPTWLEKHLDAMANAETQGELRELFADAWREKDRLCPPTEYVTALKEGYDAIKKNLGTLVVA